MSSFRDKLVDIQKELQFYKRNQNDLLSIYAKDRLQKSNKQFYNDINNSINMLLTYDTKRVARRMLDLNV